MIQLELFPLPLSFKLMFKGAHLYPKSGNAGNGNSPSLLFLMVLGLGMHGGFGGRREGFSVPVSGTSKELL